MRSGFVALVGRPNVGKSTLMNALIGEKISISTPLAQTTRNQIRGIQTLPEGQIVYLDTPGIHHARNELNRYMVDVALQTLREADLALVLIDASRPDPKIFGTQESGGKKNPGEGEDVLLLEHLKTLSLPKILVVTKIDLFAEKTDLLPLIDRYYQTIPWQEVIPICATTGENLSKLQSLILSYLPEGEALFPSEYSTDLAERFLVSEIIREKVILCTREEIPHSCAVLIERFDESRRTEDQRGVIEIDATLVIERETQKGILIGKGGEMLKRIGMKAREEIEPLLGCRVFLKLWVRVEKNWSRDPKALRRLGYLRLSP